MKIEKGEKGYIAKKKIIQSVVVLVFIAAGLSMFFICRTILGTSRNLGTVLAVLLTLPAAKALVNLILFLPYKSTDDALCIKVKDLLLPGDRAYYDLVFTSPESIMHLDFLCVRDDELIAYSADGKKSEKIVSYFTDSISKRGVKTHMHIFRKPEELYDRLRNCKAESEEGPAEEITDFIHMVLVK